MVRAGFRRNLLATALGLTDTVQRPGRAHMGKADARPRLAGEQDGAADRLLLREGRARLAMCGRIVAAFGAEVSGEPGAERIVFRMEHADTAGPRDAQHRRQEGVVVGQTAAQPFRSGRSRRCIHEGLEGDGPGLGLLLDALDVARAGAAVKGEVDQRAGLEIVRLRPQDLGARDGRRGVGHVEHGGHAADRRRGRTGDEIVFLWLAGVPHMHMRIDHAGHHMEAARVDVAWRGSSAPRAKPRDRLAAQDHVGLDDAVGQDDPPAANDTFHVRRRHDVSPCPS